MKTALNNFLNIKQKKPLCENPSHETTGGYLKKKTMHEAWADMWGNLSEGKRKLFTTLENFDADKFKQITGITV